jgi:hypothetical protein
VCRAASYADWLEVYGQAVNSEIELAIQPCPNCLEMCLMLVFVDYGFDENRGGAALWCESCLNGIYLGRVEFVGGYQKVLSGVSGRAQGGPIPNYSTIPPEG